MMPQGCEAMLHSGQSVVQSPGIGKRAQKAGVGAIIPLAQRKTGL